MSKNETRLARAAAELQRQEQRVLGDEVEEAESASLEGGTGQQPTASNGPAVTPGQLTDFETLLKRAKTLRDRADEDARAAKDERARVQGLFAQAEQVAKDAAAQLREAADATAAARELEQRANSGFAAERIRQLEQFHEDAQQLWTELQAKTSELLGGMNARSAGMVEELSRLLDRQASEHSQRLLEILDQQGAKEELLDLRADAERSLRRVEIRERSLEKEIQDRVAAASLQVQRDAELAHQAASAWKARCYELQEQLTALDQQASRGAAPAGLERRLRDVEQERDELRAELDQRPPLAFTESIGHLKDENVALRQGLAEERSRRVSAESRLQRSGAAVADLELARDRIDALTSVGRAYKEELKTAKAELDNLTSTGAGGAAFKACADMDEDAQLQDVEPTRDAPDLKTLVSETVERMASLDPPLYFDTTSIATLLAGLASSRLHVLEGISGTGKTSLPVALAQVLGGHCEVVEVASGWRDQQDLVGFYNAFERRFVERPFLRALYKAASPRYADRLSFVVLDEMNLSHPEQYFSTLLSLLENGRRQQMLELVTNEVADLPRLMRHHEKGTSLPLPRNVWFIGTANQDETTVALADKTYDRAHVMTLPPPPKASGRTPGAAPKPISLPSLNQRFEEAAQRHGPLAAMVMGLFDDGLAQSLRENFDVGWGSRLQRQVDSYVPVFAACEGDVRVAADHMFATKILRKVKNRYDVPVKHYESLRDELPDAWDLYLDGAGAPPVQSLRLLDREISRLTPRA